MRRWFAAGIVLAATALLATGPASAQQFPSKPIRIVVPFGGGSITDILGRVIGQELSKAVGQPVIVENKPGGDGAVGALEVIKAAPDGHTIFLSTNSPMSVVPHLHKQPLYDPLVDFTPITFLGRSTFFLVVHPSVPAKNFAELVAHAKANPKKLAYATGNTTSIVGTALIAKQGGIEMIQVPYKTEPQAITDLLSGQVQVMLSASTTVMPHIQDGKLKPIFTILPARSPLLPDVPSLVEAGLPKFPVGPWGAFVGPAKMPKDVIERLNKELVAIFVKPEVAAQFQKYGFTAEGTTPDELAAFLKDQLKVWGETMKIAGIEPQ